MLPTQPLKCGIIVREECEHQIECGKLKGTRMMRVAGGLASVELPVCADHEAMLRRRYPHWQLWPQSAAQ